MMPAPGGRSAMRLTSVLAINVIEAKKTKNAMHNFQGGFNAGAQRCTPVFWAVCRHGGAGSDGRRRSPGEKDQDRRDLRPHRPERRLRLRAAIYRRQDPALT